MAGNAVNGGSARNGCLFSAYSIRKVRENCTIKYCKGQQRLSLIT